MYHYDPMLKCPYNQAHVVRTSRMPMHLRKCSMQAKRKLAVCPFNAIHVMEQCLLEEHEKNCPDRIVLDSFIYDLGDSKLPDGVLPVTATANIPHNPSGECWDDCMITESVLDVVKENAKKKDVIINLIGAPPAARKAHRKQEALRRQEIRRKAEEELKAKQAQEEAELKAKQAKEARKEKAKVAKEEEVSGQNKNQKPNDVQEDKPPEPSTSKVVTNISKGEGRGRLFASIRGRGRWNNLSRNMANMNLNDSGQSKSTTPPDGPSSSREAPNPSVKNNDPGPSTSTTPPDGPSSSREDPNLSVKYNEKSWLKPLKIDMANNQGQQK